MTTKTKAAPLDPELAAQLKQLVVAEGDVAIAERAAISNTTVLRAVAGMRIYPLSARRLELFLRGQAAA